MTKQKAARISGHANIEVKVHADYRPSFATLSKQGQPDSLRYLAPAQILLTLQAAQVGAGDGERTVIQEPGYVFDTLTGVSAKLGGRVTKNMQSGRWQSGFL